MPEPVSTATGQEEVCRIAQDLIRIDTTNYGGGQAAGEMKAAEYVVGFLSALGLDANIYEAEPGRSNVIARCKGQDPLLPAPLLHGHVDVVPANAADWSIDPFGGVIKDGMLWGRGAVDMKDMNAIILATVADLMRRGEQPKRDIVLAFFADEEDNSTLGSGWMVENHPEVFEGVDVAISEVGGYSVEVGERPVFLVQTGEKGILWLRLHATGRAGHASQLNDENAILQLANAVTRIGDEPWPVTLTATTRDLIDRLREIGGFADDAEPIEIAQSTGAGATFVVPGLLNVSNVTMFNAGYKANVIPGEASAFIDVRVLPGQRDYVLNRIREIAGPNVRVEIDDDVAAIETSFEGPLIEAMARALR